MVLPIEKTKPSTSGFFPYSWTKMTQETIAPGSAKIVAPPLLYLAGGQDVIFRGHFVDKLR